MKIMLLTMLLAVSTQMVMADDAFRLVDGDVQAVIVGNDGMQSRLENGYKTIPRFFRSYVEKSTGRKLKRIKEADYDPAKHPYAVFIGNTKAGRDRYGTTLANVDRDSYVIDVTPNVVYLIGARAHSTEYAMSDFLYRSMGIATYVPTRWGTVVPKHDRVVVDSGFSLESPAFDSRAFSCLRTYHDTKHINYSGNADIPWRMYRRDKFHHAIQTFIKVEEFGKTHPEYFPEIGGKRIIVSKSSGPGPCISNPAVVRIISEKVNAYFDDPKNQDIDMISLGMTDGGWCQCSNCEALKGPNTRGNENSRAPLYYWMLNQVGAALKEKHPTKSIGVLAYAGADYPPANMTVARNIVPYICLTRANWGDPAVRADHIEQTVEWTSRVDKIGTYEYLYGAGFMVPRIYHQHLADYLRLARRQSGGGFYAEIYSNHALDGPKAWVAEKLLWNPFQDPAELQSKWCAALFEEAAEPMNAYFAFLEACNTRNVERCPQVGTTGKDRTSKFYLLQDESQFNLFTPEEVTHAQSLLAKATAATQREDIRERITYFADGFRVTELSVRAYHAFNKAKALYQDGASHGQVLAAMIEGEANAPEEDPVLLMKELTVKDPSAFTDKMPVAISTATELSMRIVNGAPWDAVYERIRSGERGREALVTAARDELLKMAPAGWETETFAKRRVGTLAAMTRRIMVAPRVAKAPTIDGDISDGVWQWQSDAPWWNWKSGIDYPAKNRVAFCHDGKTLYWAFRCEQDNLDKARTVEGYGAAAWKYISVELHLNPDRRDATEDEVKRYQVIPALGGGLYSMTHDVVREWKVTQDETGWQAELSMDLAAIQMTPDRFAALRMNMIHNTREAGHYGKGWFPSSAGHKAGHSRGWLVFGE